MSKSQWLLLAIVVILLSMLALGILPRSSAKVDAYAPTSVQGSIIFAEACAQCHGPSGNYLGGIPRLAGSHMPPEQIRRKVKEGGRLMPRFPNIQGEGLTNLAQFVNRL